MEVCGKDYRTIWRKPENREVIEIIDQRALPHELVIEELTSLEEVSKAISEMHVRGAPLIGVTAAYGMYLAALAAVGSTDFDKQLCAASDALRATRPTAVNLLLAIDGQLKAAGSAGSSHERLEKISEYADKLAEDEVKRCYEIGLQGLTLLEELSTKRNGETVNILTHCNAGWLGCVDYGTATAPIYIAHDRGISLHVWVDETRPRNQGARLTAWELAQHGISHTVITDNAGGHLMQRGMVDAVLVGTDRVSRRGDVANKIGTYLKALAAHDNDVPFYVALPSSSIDWEIADGSEIPIEERSRQEVTHISGFDGESIREVRLTPAESPASNYAFDVTPARLISAFITERGACSASEEGLLSLFPEHG